MLLATNSFSEFFFLDELHRNSSPHFDIRHLQETLLETQGGKRQVNPSSIRKLVRTLPIVEVPSCQEMVSPQNLHGRAAEEQYLGVGARRINSLRRRHSSIWETGVKAEVCSGSNHFPEALRWIEEVVMATSVGDLQTSRSIFGRPFPNIEALDAKIATSLKKIIQNWTFRKKLYVVTDVQGFDTR